MIFLTKAQIWGLFFFFSPHYCNMDSSNGNTGFLQASQLSEKDKHNSLSLVSRIIFSPISTCSAWKLPHLTRLWRTVHKKSWSWEAVTPPLQQSCTIRQVCLPETQSWGRFNLFCTDPEGISQHLHTSLLNGKLVRNINEANHILFCCHLPNKEERLEHRKTENQPTF